MANGGCWGTLTEPDLASLAQDAGLHHESELNSRVILPKLLELRAQMQLTLHPDSPAGAAAASPTAIAFAQGAAYAYNRAIMLAEDFRSYARKTLPRAK